MTTVQKPLQEPWISHIPLYVDRVEGNPLEGEVFPKEAKPQDAQSTQPKVVVENEKLNKLIAQSHTVLLKVSSFFPFDFFPDEVTVDENKVNIVERIFFFSEYIHSVLIKDIMNIVVEAGFLFATLKLIPMGNKDAPIQVRYLKKHDAVCARRIIQGLIAAKKADIDLGVIPPDVLKAKVEELGMSQETAESGL